MSFEIAVRLTEILLALAFIQQSLEHLAGPRIEQILFAARIILCLLLLFDIQTSAALAGLLGIALACLYRFQGPYNGGSDRMSLLILCSLTLIHFMPTQNFKEVFFGYLGLQLMLSYVISGWVKLINPEWRHGRALNDVFRFSAYPVSESLRGWADRPNLLWAMSWAVISFEVLFPLSLLTQYTLLAGLGIGAVFHLANACLFGLNRFFWIWLAAYPSILWLQDRLIGA